jgi:hypothetical protein
LSYAPLEGPYWGNAQDIVLSPQFAGLWIQPTREQQAKIDQRLLIDPVPPTLVVWPYASGLILVTGYDKFPALKRHGLPFRILKRPFPDADAVGSFIILEQLKEPERTVLGSSFLRGLRYLDEKQNGGDRRSAGVLKSLRSANALGERLGYSGRTIRRDGRVADAVLRLAQAGGGDHVIPYILISAARLTCLGVLALAKLPLAKQREAMGLLMLNGKLPRGWASGGAAPTITLPVDPKGAAIKLLRRWGREGTVTFAQAIVEEALAQAEKKTVMVAGSSRAETEFPGSGFPNRSLGTRGWQSRSRSKSRSKSRSRRDH